ncbi:hypothetical protein CEUSTIGMA_g8339.t1 [Chlamydomonas eustigma]|uniref:EF-hand domain-containing protein n=1 Tax=Chlamydomonas eustigma TaxID=1157962 RepID=A0A250XCV0_9CHLO|nr:hypothetical protein CEUSTIGMA_g8339.t1 [Chlamydomonas eustigma]|eukprot:GAX80904.1 hypothetical protein CEUSTIGMA_g8339.t1 [Chlamydomonas eustigma]
MLGLVASQLFGRSKGSASRLALNGLNFMNSEFRSRDYTKIVSPPITYIAGEEMTRYCMDLILTQCVNPFVEISKWEYFDCSCKNRDATDDQVLKDAVASGAKLGSIFKEPTVTPSATQVKQMGLKKALPSPNGAMRKGWNGITISRDTIHIPGIELGFKEPVLFDRHAVGGEYGAGWKAVGSGKLVTTFFPDDDTAPVIIEGRHLKDKNNVAVVYHNPLDNVPDLAHHFFSRCLEAKVVPYVVTKKTVFKWQESFWQIHKEIFDKDYKKKFLEAGLLEKTRGELQHLISDAATMQIVRWLDGGFGMVSHNYDGDMLTDEIAQIHRSPGFITSNLIGKSKSGNMIKEFEASHGTVADMWNAHLRGEETSFNPLGMLEALMGAMNHAAALQGGETLKVMTHYTSSLRNAIHNTFRYGEGTRDLSGPTGLTTEAFVSKVAKRLARYLERDDCGELAYGVKAAEPLPVDVDAVYKMFGDADTDRDGMLDKDEFIALLVKLGIAPLKERREETEDKAAEEAQPADPAAP